MKLAEYVLVIWFLAASIEASRLRHLEHQSHNSTEPQHHLPPGGSEVEGRGFSGHAAGGFRYSGDAAVGHKLSVDVAGGVSFLGDAGDGLTFSRMQQLDCDFLGMLQANLDPPKMLLLEQFVDVLYCG
ncbi:unnamed protein product [Diabrotica balteata]|uniref:Uncharacterized protein n=1 Tax=Diabrotica balteata TaxID=107213 RepID=A0A9N9XFA2_DIABA|nr:unnamed protein product [Diabrotica balteata]